MRCRKAEAWQICGTWTMVTSCVSPNSGVAFSAGFRCRQRQSRSGAKPTENRSHLIRERPGCSVNSLFHLHACAGSVLTPHDYITNVHKRLGNRVWVGGGQCRCCGSIIDPQLERAETCSTTEATRGHYACVHAVVCGLKLADPGITSEPRLTASQSRPVDFRTTAAVPGRSAALECVASIVSAAARGDAAQAAFHSKLSYYRNEIVDLRQLGIHHCPLVWTADGRPHPAVIRTLQYAADIASTERADVGGVTSAQMETPDPNRSSTAESSHDTSSSAKSIGTGRAAPRWYH